MLACYGVLWLYDKIQQYVYYYISLFSAESESGRFRSFAFLWGRHDEAILENEKIMLICNSDMLINITLKTEKNLLLLETKRGWCRMLPTSRLISKNAKS